MAPPRKRQDLPRLVFFGSKTTRETSAWPVSPVQIGRKSGFGRAAHVTGSHGQHAWNLLENSFSAPEQPAPSVTYSAPSGIFNVVAVMFIFWFWLIRRTSSETGRPHKSNVNAFHILTSYITSRRPLNLQYSRRKSNRQLHRRISG